MHMYTYTCLYIHIEATATQCSTHYTPHTHTPFINARIHISGRIIKVTNGDRSIRSCVCCTVLQRGAMNCGVLQWLILKVTIES